MKKTILLHAELSRVIAMLGHGDLLVIGDAGLPIPAGTPRIDLAVTANLPRMLDVVQAVLSEMQVESATVAEELARRNPVVSEGLRALLGSTPVAAVSHEDLKAQCAGARAVVRTGEFTPYANVILRSGVVF
jgi:D-ribose pyranase